IGDSTDLIPQRLGVDRQAFARHHADLAFKREMIGVLRDGDADPKLRRIPTAREDLCGPGRRHDRPVTPASILLADVVLDLIRELHVGDSSRWLALACHFDQLAAARGALSFCGCEFVPNLHDRQRRLWTRAMTGLRWPQRPGS